MRKIEVRSRSREEMIDVTDEVRRAVAESGVRDGLCCVFSPHTTAGVTIQENSDPDVRSDMLGHLAQLVPQSPKFRHSEGNADAHIKTSVVGPSSALIVEGGKILLGAWQAVYLCEFDGPRSRNLWIQTVPT
jgi:secondary thiamine-phosphate synthase enzyme